MITFLICPSSIVSKVYKFILTFSFILTFQDQTELKMSKAIRVTNLCMVAILFISILSYTIARPVPTFNDVTPVETHHTVSQIFFTLYDVSSSTIIHHVEIITWLIRNKLFLKRPKRLFKAQKAYKHYFVTFCLNYYKIIWNNFH